MSHLDTRELRGRWPWTGPRRLRGAAADTLIRLAEATQLWKDAAAERGRLIDLAISEGHSEREIGRAAGISGPAVHQRKAARGGGQD